MPQGWARSVELASVETAATPAMVWLGSDWGQASQLPASRDVAQQLAASRADSVVIDGTSLTREHPRAAAFIWALGAELAARGVSVSHQNLGENLGALIGLAGTSVAQTPAKAPSPRLFERIGSFGWQRYLAAVSVLEFIGYAAAATPRFVLGRSQSSLRDFVNYLQEAGAASLPVVTIVNLLVGTVLGFVGAIQLKAFGAGMYLADLVGIAVAREMAALMTAIVMSGRIGAAFAAHLATMQANEEVDALRMTGVSPFDFLVMPRLAALSLMMPLIYLYATAVGIIGGLLVAELVIGTPPAAFIHRLQSAVAAQHFIIGFAKSVFFGVLIALASCYLGLNAGRNAAEVGRAATRTVVVCIIGIIIVDAVFALGTNALGI
ncbi:ABC transporter permease [Salinisphaera sp. USBA-960]|nr:ABC transporter permease [Salifodinibacter halophilus]